MRDSTLYWSEYRSSIFWDQRVNARAVSYDLRNGRKRLLRDRENALYPTPLPDGRVASVGYDYTGRYSIDFGGGRSFAVPDTLSVHGLAYDDLTGTLAFITLGDAGMVDLPDRHLQRADCTDYAAGLYEYLQPAGRGG